MDREKLLENFIQGRLTEKDQQEFDRLLTTDEVFRTEVNFHSNLKSVTQAEDDDNFRALLADFEAEAGLEKSSIPRIPTKWLVAASVILLIGISYFFMIDQNLTSQELFIKNFEPYPNVVHPIVRGKEGIDTKTVAFRAYQTGDYETSAELFEELYTVTEESPYLFYQANSLIQLNKAKEAIPLLQNHLKAGDDLSDKTNWYLAMAYLQIDDKENAIKMLESVLRNGKFKAEEAKDILDALE